MQGQTAFLVILLWKFDVDVLDFELLLFRAYEVRAWDCVIYKMLICSAAPSVARNGRPFFRSSSGLH